MINLQLLDMLYMDMVLSNETAQYLAVSNNLSLTPKYKVLFELLQYARRALGVSVAVARVIDTVNGKHALCLLGQRHSAILDEMSRLNDKHQQNKPRLSPEAGLVDLIKLQEMACYNMVLGLIQRYRSQIMKCYGSARKIKKPETSILRLGKLLAQMGENALGICEAVLDFAGYSHLRVNADRLFRFDYLTDEEFDLKSGMVKYEKAGDAERLSILADLWRADQFDFDHQVRLELGHIFVVRSPWDATHILGLVVLSQDILKSQEELAGSITEAPMLFLEYVEVASDIKGCGIGTRLVRWAMDVAAQKGYREMGLGGDQGDETWGFWRRLHFKQMYLVDGVSAILHT